MNPFIGVLLGGLGVGFGIGLAQKLRVEYIGTNSTGYKKGREDALRLISDNELCGGTVEMLEQRKIVPHMIKDNDYSHYSPKMNLAGWDLIDADITKAKINVVCKTPLDAFKLFRDRKEVAIEINKQVDALEKARKDASK